MNDAIRQTIRDYLDQAEDREHTMRCFLGMLEGGEATFADFAAVDPAVADQLRAMHKKVVFYVATLSRYVLVEAEDERQARNLGEAKLREMVAGLRGRDGRDLPIVIRTVRPATPDEIALATPETPADATAKVADAIRSVTAAMTKAIDSGQRSTRIDTEDVIDLLLAIADRIDPPFDSPG